MSDIINDRIRTFDDIPSLTHESNYKVDVGWSFLLEYLDKSTKDGLILDPDFQRGHVWTEEQQVRFVEYALRGGCVSGFDLYFNCPGWNRGLRLGQYVIVDGLQRLTAATKFLRGDLRAYGKLYGEFKGRLGLIRPAFKWHINDLETRAQVLTWYLEFNGGGTPHSQGELTRVAELLATELTKKGAK